MELITAEKLKNIPRIIFKTSSDNSLMEEELSLWNITNYKRHQEKYTTENYKDWKDLIIDVGLMQTPEELSEAVNTIDAIVEWYDTTDEKYCIICTDNISFKNVKHWPFDWTFLMQQLPYNWDCIQLFAYSKQMLRMHVHPWVKSSMGHQCFMITRYFAKRIKHFHYIDKKFKLHYPSPDKSVPMDVYGNLNSFFYDLGITYTFPVFSVCTDLENLSAAAAHGAKYDLPELCSEGIEYWWEDKGPMYSNFELFHYKKGEDEWKMELHFEVTKTNSQIHMDERRPRMIWI